MGSGVTSCATGAVTLERQLNSATERLSGGAIMSFFQGPSGRHIPLSPSPGRVKRASSGSQKTGPFPVVRCEATVALWEPPQLT